MSIVEPILILAIILGVAGFFYLRKKKSEPPKLTREEFSPVTVNLSFAYSPGMSGSAWEWNYPAQDGIHCIQKSAAGLAIAAGQKLSLEFELSGDGQVFSVEPPGPPTVHLYMQRKGDDFSARGVLEQYRYWSESRIGNPSAGTYQLTQTLIPEKWTDVHGQYGTMYPDRFQACLDNIEVIGFTFGGSGGNAAHGQYAQGQVHFSLKSFTVFPAA